MYFETAAFLECGMTYFKHNHQKESYVGSACGIKLYLNNTINHVSLCIYIKKLYYQILLVNNVLLSDVISPYVCADVDRF